MEKKLQKLAELAAEGVKLVAAVEKWSKKADKAFQTAYTGISDSIDARRDADEDGVDSDLTALENEAYNSLDSCVSPFDIQNSGEARELAKTAKLFAQRYAKELKAAKADHKEKVKAAKKDAKKDEADDFGV